MLEEKKDDLQLNEEFGKPLNNFIGEKLDDKELNNDNNDYFNTLKNYIDDNDSVKNKMIYKNDKNNLINDAKIIRSLSQLSYRILNYFLYVNLFFE
jgi:hypothetical protein